MAGRVSLIVFRSFCTCALTSRSRALSRRICRFSSQRSETKPLASIARAVTPSWMVGCSSIPCAAKLRWSIRASIPFSSRTRLTVFAHASRQDTSCSSLFHRSEMGFCRPYFVLFGYLDARTSPLASAAEDVIYSFFFFPVL